MGRYQAYPEYKDSCIDWLGQVPSHWAIKKIKWEITASSGVDQKSEDGLFDLFGANGIIGKSNSSSINHTNGVVLVGRVGSAGAINFVQNISAVSDNALVIKNHISNVPRFDYYLLSSLNLEEFVSKNAQPLITASNIRDITAAIPINRSEKICIANFLDHETAKIDTLIEQQQQLIQLLKEKRQAVISHAVTKGLNPNAPMKDSGVEWLGEVPAHWSVSRIKNIVSIPVTDGPHETPNFIDAGVPFVSAEAVSSGEVDFSKIRGFISEEANKVYSKKYFPKKYDIYMVKSGATTGLTAIVETDEVFNIWSPLAVIRCGVNYEPYFVLNFMRSEPFQEAVKLHWSFGTQQNIGMGVIENLYVTCPPKSEAEEIARYLQSEDRKFRAVVSIAYDAIQLMQERRTALISATVTGKIDVRKWQAHNNNNDK